MPATNAKLNNFRMSAWQVNFINYWYDFQIMFHRQVQIR